MTLSRAQRQHWKAMERKVASFFGCKRVPLSGSNSGHNTSSDTLHKLLYIEVKTRAKWAILNLFFKILPKAISEDKVPVIAICKKHSKGFWLLVNASDLLTIAKAREEAIKNGGE